MAEKKTVRENIARNILRKNTRVKIFFWKIIIVMLI
jgi:hypothetical protein